MKIVIATIKSWNILRSEQMKEKLGEETQVTIITDKDELTYDKLTEINPDFVFFPHWSWIIPKNIYQNFNCVVFHMTDLPFGRGGSPLQNLIVRGITNTKISALKVTEGLDTGDIYFKQSLDLSGTVDEIFTRAADIIFNDMIPQFLEKPLVAVPQTGEVVEFKRRNINDSEIPCQLSSEQIYDYIRMLDGEGYPNAFINYGGYKLKFTKAKLSNNKVVAQVEWEKED